MRKAEMTGHERVEALYSKKPTDRVPVVHKGYAFCAKHVGIPVADVYKDPKASFECQKQTYADFGFDGGPFYTFIAYGAGEFGGKIEYKKDPNSFGPEVSERPIKDWEDFDIDSLALPDPKTAGCIPHEMEFAHMQEKEGSEIAFICGTPFTHTANLFGVPSFLECVLIDPDMAHAALRKMTDHILQVAEYFIGTFGPDRVLARAVSPTESNALISPKILQEFSMPYVKELNQKVLDMGAKSCYIHMCGDHNLNLPYWAEVPFSKPGKAGMISVGKETSLADAAKYFPEHAICGNIDPALLMNGTPEEVYKKSCEIIEEGKALLKYRFEFMAGCEVGPGTPEENVRMMVKAVNDVGWYD
ncbi:MAG: uroporphyrinogen decarboxylase family protein [Oscillospiraceae bacterium]|nr:uroporphyrinogen decarboxylase family protein [Oscillospiraceae bacterium]